MPTPSPSPTKNPLKDLIEGWKLLIPKEPYDEEMVKKALDVQDSDWVEKALPPGMEPSPTPNASPSSSPETVKTKVIKETGSTYNPNWKRQLDLSRVALMERQAQLFDQMRAREKAAREELAGIGNRDIEKPEEPKPFDYTLPATRQAIADANKEYETLAGKLQVPKEETDHFAEALIAFLPALVGTGLGAAIGGPGMAGAGLHAGASGGVNALEKMRADQKERRQAAQAAAKEELLRKSGLQKEYIDAISKAEIAPLEAQAIVAKAVAPEMMKINMEERKAKLKDLLDRATNDADKDELRAIETQLRTIDDQTKEARGKPGEKTVTITEQPLETMEEIKAKYRIQVKEAEDKERSDLEKARREHQTTLETLKAQFQAERDAAKSQADKDKLTQQHENKKDELKQTHEQKIDQIKEEGKLKKDLATQAAKDKLNQIKSKGSGKSGSGKASTPKLDKDVQTKVDVIARESAKKEVIANKLEAAIAKLDDPSLSQDLKITQAEQLLKVLNSQDGQDAVGAEEAKRIGSLLEYKIFNFTRPGSFFGRDLDKFRDSVALTVNRLRDEVKSNNGLIDQYKAGSKPEGKQIPVLSGKKPMPQVTKPQMPATQQPKRSQQIESEIQELEKRKQEILNRRKAGKK